MVGCRRGRTVRAVNPISIASPWEGSNPTYQHIYGNFVTDFVVEFDSPFKLGGHIIHCKLNPDFEKNKSICTNNLLKNYKY